MKRVVSFLIATLVISAPAFGQTMYKCPDPSGNVKFQQMPCAPTGGGEAMEVKSIKTTGANAQMSAEGRAYMQDNAERRSAVQEQKAKDFERWQEVDLEKQKIRAAEEQAAAQRATARAIQEQQTTVIIRR
ncbi:MAG: DUF4124 domain-containing protein [Gammaproteobacteria bacterium]|nr:DUF4124 domain-containing protein [Gammaproteobacteria bacterium]